MDPSPQETHHPPIAAQSVGRASCIFAGKIPLQTPRSESDDNNTNLLKLGRNPCKHIKVCHRMADTEQGDVATEPQGRIVTYCGGTSASFLPPPLFKNANPPLALQFARFLPRYDSTCSPTLRFFSDIVYDFKRTTTLTVHS